MSQSFSAEPPPPLPRPQAQNMVGLVGFIISLCGIVCLPVFPVGFIVSLFGLKQEPKGFAIAGAIIGAIGSLLLIAVVVIYAVMAAAFIKMAPNMQQSMQTMVAEEQARQSIEQYRLQNGDLPDSQTGNQLITGQVDGWQTPLRYDHDADEGPSYRIRSAGADRVFDTPDDVTVNQSGVSTGNPFGTGPFAPAAPVQPQPVVEEPEVEAPKNAVPVEEDAVPSEDSR